MQTPAQDEIILTHMEAALAFIDSSDEFGEYQFVKHIITYLQNGNKLARLISGDSLVTHMDAAANVKWKIDHEYSTLSVSLSQTLASPLLERLSSWEMVAVINTMFINTTMFKK